MDNKIESITITENHVLFVKVQGVSNLLYLTAGDYELASIMPLGPLTGRNFAGVEEEVQKDVNMLLTPIN